MRVVVTVLIVAAVVLVADARVGGRALSGCKKQNCDGYKKKNNCHAAKWRSDECECACTSHGWGAATHDCGDWNCKAYEGECKDVYMDFKDCQCLCHGVKPGTSTPLAFAGAWPGAGQPGQPGGYGFGGAGGHGGGFGGGRGGAGGRGGGPGQPGAPGRR